MKGRKERLTYENEKEKSLRPIRLYKEREEVIKEVGQGGRDTEF